jgi:hypothetical protein
MSDNSPSAQEWRQLYEVMGRLKELAPWQWMEEGDIFAVQNPETAEWGYVSVMGMGGEHYAVAVYQGAEGLYGFWGLQEAGDEMAPEQLLAVPELQASFEDRETVEKEDREVMKELGLKFRGRHAWPAFRSYRPGYAPWFIEAAEARFLYHALEQTLEVAARYRDNPDLLDGVDDEHFFGRVPEQKNGGITWRDELVPVPEAPTRRIEIVVNMGAIDHLKQIKTNIGKLEVDVFLFPGRIGERGERPYFPYMLFMVDGRSGFIYAAETMQPFPSLDAMWGEVVNKIVITMARQGVRPKQISVQNHFLFQLLESVAEELKIKVKGEYLNALEQAKESVLTRFM